MTLVFDTRTTHKSGIYRYAVSLAKEVARLSHNASIRLVVLYDQYDPELANVCGVHNADYLKLLVVHCFTRVDLGLRRLIAEQGADFYFSAHYFCDPNLAIPSIVTLHDLIRLRHPEYSYTSSSFIAKFGMAEYEHLLDELGKLGNEGAYVPRPIDAVREYVRRNTLRMARSAYKVATVSMTSKADIQLLLDIPPEKIILLPDAVDKSIFMSHEAAPAPHLQKVIGRVKYCLYVGNTYPHKRVPFIIKAFCGVAAASAELSKLVLVISNNEQAVALKMRLEKDNYADRCIVLSDITDSDLAVLYSRAKALVLASVNEGFCLPALEAAYCGVPVIAPTLPVFDEVLRGYGQLYPLHDHQKLQELIALALRAELPKRDVAVLSSQSWTESAKALLETVTNHSASLTHAHK